MKRRIKKQKKGFENNCQPCRGCWHPAWVVVSMETRSSGTATPLVVHPDWSDGGAEKPLRQFHPTLSTCCVPCTNLWRCTVRHIVIAGPTFGGAQLGTLLAGFHGCRAPDKEMERVELKRNIIRAHCKNGPGPRWLRAEVAQGLL